MNSEINDWLDSGQDYDAGLLLLIKFGQSQHLNRILQRSEPCREHHDTIVYELTLLVDAPVELSLKTIQKARRETIPVRPKAVVEEDILAGDADRILFEQINKNRHFCL